MTLSDCNIPSKLVHRQLDDVLVIARKSFKIKSLYQAMISTVTLQKLGQQLDMVFTGSLTM